MNQTLISIDLKSDFGFFRKPETNSGINLSYNMLHKPALLGVLGAIVGLDGYREKGKIPEYYLVFQNLKIGIEPLNHEKGNYSKTTIKYSNTAGYANKGNYLTEEVMLIKPEYRCYILLNKEDENHRKLYEYLKTGITEFIPYFGKNEFMAWWDTSSFNEYDFDENYSQSSKTIKTLIEKNKNIIKGNTEQSDEGIGIEDLDYESTGYEFLYFERLPMGFNHQLHQYELGEFIFSTFKIKDTLTIQNLYYLKEKDYYVQLL